MAALDPDNTRRWENYANREVIVAGAKPNLQKVMLFSAFATNYHAFAGFSYKPGKKGKKNRNIWHVAPTRWPDADTVPPKSPGEEVDRGKVALDQFTATLLGYHSEPKVVAFQAAFDAKTGLIDYIDVQYDDLEKWHPLIMETIESARSAIKACRANALKAERELKATSNNLEGMLHIMERQRKMQENAKAVTDESAAVTEVKEESAMEIENEPQT